MTSGEDGALEGMVKVDLDNSRWRAGVLDDRAGGRGGSWSATRGLGLPGSSPSTPTKTRSSSAGAWYYFPRPLPEATPVKRRPGPGGYRPSTGLSPWKNGGNRSGYPQ
jgi:hypothetical protein